MYPIPLVLGRPRRSSASTREPQARARRRELFLTDVRAACCRCRRDRPIRQLRVFQVLPKTETHVANRAADRLRQRRKRSHAAGDGAGRGRRFGLLPRAGP